MERDPWGVKLSGGFVNDVVRVGDTVRRVPGERAAFVHDLLGHFERSGFGGAPRLLGIDAAGREMLTYIDGHAAWESVQPPAVTSDESLAQVMALVREFHDLTAGTPLAGAAEVVCHNDLSPRNTVYRDSGTGLRPVAFIDWDIAAPGERIHDIAHACWQYLGLGSKGTTPSDPSYPVGRDVAAAGKAMRLMCDSYGLADRSRLIATVLWWQDRCWRGIESAAAAGDGAMARLRDSGVAAGVKAAYHWVSAHQDALRSALRRPRR